jgi:putative transposase
LNCQFAYAKLIAVMIMARKARKDLKTNVFSILQQSDVKVFLNDADREAFIHIIEQTQKKFNFICYAYCLLDDYQFKLIINVNKQSISKIMQSMIVSYTHHRQLSSKLFPQRFKSKPLYSKEEVMAEINNIHKKGSSIYNSYCIVNHSIEHSIDWLTPIHQQPIHFVNQSLPVSDEKLRGMLHDFLKQHNCDMIEIQKDKALRNQCIMRLRHQTNCSLKQIGYLFGGLSESTISKILKQDEH